jgi:hypothetical protein
MGLLVVQVLDAMLDLTQKHINKYVTQKSIQKAETGTHSSSAKDIPVCEILRCQISNGKPRQDDAGSGFDTLGKLLIDDIPLRINNGLVLSRIFQPDLRINLS